jgi:uncharacterized protein YciI
MQFLVLAYDGRDEGAVERRLQARPAHLAVAEKMAASGMLRYATAILDESDKMIGSMLVLDVGSRDDVDRWLEEDPYVTGNVWQDVTVTPCRTAPMFATG